MAWLRVKAISMNTVQNSNSGAGDGSSKSAQPPPLIDKLVSLFIKLGEVQEGGEVGLLRKNGEKS
jgi:hypothetical protein